MELTKGILGLLICSALQIAAQSVILTSDQQLDGLTNPDKKMDLSVGYKKNICSLREICEEKKVKVGKKNVPLKITDSGIELNIDDSVSGEWLTIDI